MKRKVHWNRVNGTIITIIGIYLLLGVDLYGMSPPHARTCSREEHRQLMEKLAGGLVVVLAATIFADIQRKDKTH